jgi:acetyl esterase/lipase
MQQPQSPTRPTRSAVSSRARAGPLWHFLTIDGNRPFGIFTSQWCASDTPGIYYTHGGGMILGDLAGEDSTAAMRCAEVDAVVVSVEYRLAPEPPTLHPWRTVGVDVLIVQSSLAGGHSATTTPDAPPAQTPLRELIRHGGPRPDCRSGQPAECREQGRSARL